MAGSKHIVGCGDIGFIIASTACGVEWHSVGRLWHAFGMHRENSLHGFWLGGAPSDPSTAVVLRLARRTLLAQDDSLTRDCELDTGCIYIARYLPPRRKRPGLHESGKLSDASTSQHCSTRYSGATAVELRFAKLGRSMVRLSS